MCVKSSVGIFGSTGSIGTQTLEVIRLNSDKFFVECLTAYSNTALLIEQIKEFRPKQVCVGPEIDKKALLGACNYSLEIYEGTEGLSELASSNALDIVMMAIVGFSAFPPLMSAIRSGKKIALANKESVISAGAIIIDEVRARNALLIPVDSEHNSIYQALQARPEEKPRRIIITASGGPFLNREITTLGSVTVEEAINHPRWNMGKKLSLDSATLMNKGLEVIEAAVLFELPESKVDVLINPQSFIHGFVEYEDASSIAVCYQPTMQVPISHALSICRTSITGLSDSLTISSLNASKSEISGGQFIDTINGFNLNFIPPSYERFPMLRMAREASRKGGNAPIVLNASNEIAASAFFDGKIGFTDISKIVEKSLERARHVDNFSIEEVEALDLEARMVARGQLGF